MFYGAATRGLAEAGCRYTMGREGGGGHVDGCGWCDGERGSGAQPKLNRMINNR